MQKPTIEKKKKPTLVKNKVIKLSINAKYVKDVTKEIQSRDFLRGVFLFERKDGAVGINWHNCSHKDKHYLMNKILLIDMLEHM